MINTIQIDLMKHAIGLRKDRVKRYKYDAFRNYFTVPSPDPEWEDLVKKEYAVSEKMDRGIGANPTCYFVTRKGMDKLEEITMIKITETD